MFKQLLCFCLSLLALGSAGQVVIYNGGFEQFTAKGPSSWMVVVQKGSKFTAVQDFEHKVSGKSSVRLEVDVAVKGRMPHSLLQFRNVPAFNFARTGKFSFRFRGKGVKGAMIVFIGATDKNPAAQWESYPIPDGDFDWEKVSGEVEFPAGVKRIYCYIRMRNPGTLWVDDAEMTLQRSVKRSSGFIANPGFEKVDRRGNAYNWKVRRHPGFRVNIKTDAKVRAAGRRSMLIHGLEPLKNLTQFHAIYQTVSFPEQLTSSKYCRFSFKIKASEIKHPAVVFTGNNAQKPLVLWKSFALPYGTYDWQTYSGYCRIPVGVKNFRMAIRSRSAGYMWIDDVCAEIFDFVPQEIGFGGKINALSNLPEGWEHQKIYSNENESTVKIVNSGSTFVAVQQYIGGTPLAGLRCALPAHWLQAEAVKISGSAKGMFQIGVEFYNAQSVLMGSIFSERIESPAAAKNFELAFVVPPKTASARIILYNCAKGNTEFGSLKIDRSDPATARKMEIPAISVAAIPVDYSRMQHGVKVPEFNTFTDSPSKLHFRFTGDPKRLKSPALVVDLPADVKVADAVCPYRNMNYWRAEKFTVTPLKRPEGEYRRYRFADLNAFKILNERNVRLMLLFMPETPGAVMNGKPVFYHLENDGKAMAEKSFLLNILPAMKPTPNPKRFAFFRWDDSEVILPNEEVFRASIRQLEESGYTWCTRRDKSMPHHYRLQKELEKRNWRFFLKGCAINIHQRNSSARVTRMKVQLPILANGRVKPGTDFCPTFQTCNQEFVRRYKDFVRRRIRSFEFSKNDWVVADSEQFDPMNWCFCDLCRTEFARRLKLPKVPDTETILKNHRVAWRDFRVWHDTEFIKIVSGIAAEYGLLMADYNYINDYSDPNYHEKFYQVAKNTLANDKYQGIHIPSYYHVHDAMAYDTMVNGRKHLTKPYYPICGVDGNPSWQAPREVLSPERFSMMMISAAVAGCPGFGVYPGEWMDAKFMLAADRTMAAIAKYEQMLLDGKDVKYGEVKVDLPQSSSNFRFVVKELNGRKLGILLNYHSTASAKVEIKTGKGVIKEVVPARNFRFVEL